MLLLMQFWWQCRVPISLGYTLDDVNFENPGYTLDSIPLWLLIWTTDMQDLSERDLGIKQAPPVNHPFNVAKPWREE